MEKSENLEPGIIKTFPLTLSLSFVFTKKTQLKIQDPQQLQRKRHIGNDIVALVFQVEKKKLMWYIRGQNF